MTVHNGLSRSSQILAVIISSLNFLFFLTFQNNIAYQYIPLLFDKVVAGNAQALIVMLVIMKLCFAGFCLGMLLLNRLKRYFPLTRSLLLTTAGFLVLCCCLFNYFYITSLGKLYTSVIVSIFSTSLIFGLIYAEVVNASRGNYPKMLFLLMLGSAFGVLVNHCLTSYLPFIFTYVILFVILQIMAMKESGSRARLISVSFVLLALIYTTRIDNLGQFYAGPEHAAAGDNGILVLTKHTPDGIHDVLYVPDKNQYIMFSEKNSASVISVKGRIQDVEHGTQIPYSIRHYRNNLLIAVGGGQAITAALHYGVESIKGVEISKGRVDLMNNEFAEYSKGLFKDPRVTVTAQSGREFLRQNTEKFDLISIVGPRGKKIASSLPYEPLVELFSEEAIDSYLNVLDDNGILHIDLSIGMDPLIFIGLKRRFDELKDNLLIFTYANGPGKNRKNCVALLYSKKFDLKPFYEKNKNKYSFIFYPGKSLSAADDIIVRGFANPSLEYRRLDKHFFGIFNQTVMRRNLAIIIGIYLLIILISIVVFKNIRHAMYLGLGVGYELVLYSFAIWLSLFTVNLFQLIPLVFTIFFLLGSFGYLHSRKTGPIIVSIISFALALLFVLMGPPYNIIYQIQQSSGGLAFIWAITLITAYLITFPFGFLIRNEKHVHRAFASDYGGSLLALPVIFLVPNLDYLMLIASLIYFIVGATLIATRGQYSR